MMKLKVLPFFVAAVYLFLYLPIGILVLLSFNKNAHFMWRGFSLHWYHELFESVEVWNALSNSLIVAVSAVCLSLIMGTMLVFYTRNKLKKINLLFYGTLAAPEIVLAVGLLSLFAYLGVSLGLISLIVGHTLLGLGFVVPMVYARMSEMDEAIIEAAMDLGATQTYTLYSVVLPFLAPALFGAGLLVFITSFDDFVFSFFCAGASAQTLPIYIFSVIRTGATPMINALSTVLLCITGLFVLLFSLFTLRKTGLRP